MKLSLKTARVNANMSQAQVAKRLGVHVQTYRNLEENSDTATIGQAKKLSALLKVSYDENFFTSRLYL
jgi:hypothetical protein